MNFVIACIHLTALGLTAAQLCRTPDNKNGICVDITECEHFKLNFLFSDTDHLREYKTCPFSKVSLLSVKKMKFLTKIYNIPD